MSIPAFGPSSSSNSVAMFLIYSAFLLCSLGCPILLQNCCVSLALGCWCHLPQHVSRIFFRCFGMSCFVCVALSFVDIFVIFLFSPVLSALFPQVVLLFFLVLLFSLFGPSCFSVSPLFYRFYLFSLFFLSVFPIECPIQVLIICTYVKFTDAANYETLTTLRCSGRKRLLPS